MNGIWGFVPDPLVSAEDRDAWPAVRLTPASEVEWAPPVASDDPAHDHATCQVCTWLRRQPGVRGTSLAISHGPPQPVENPNSLHKFEVSGEIVPGWVKP